jgi:hypothetical protein
MKLNVGNLSKKKQMNIPDELTTLLFEYLEPIEHLLTIPRVCKQWRQLFIQHRMNCSEHNYTLLLNYALMIHTFEWRRSNNSKHHRTSYSVSILVIAIFHWLYQFLSSFFLRSKHQRISMPTGADLVYLIGDYNRISCRSIEAKCLVLGDDCVTLLSAWKKLYPQRSIIRGVHCRVNMSLTQSTTIELNINTVAGEEYFSYINDYYLHGTSIVFLCFNINSRKSLQNVNHWMNLKTQSLGRIDLNQMKYSVLVGLNNNGGKRRISKQEAQKFGFNSNMPYIEVNLKNLNEVQHPLTYTAFKLAQ